MAFMCLIVIIASSSTSDMQLSQFVPKLFAMGLTNATNVIEICTIYGVDCLCSIFSEAGHFYQNLEQIINVADYFIAHHNTQVPSNITVQDLSTLHSVGYKTANIVVTTTFDRVDRIPSDIHVLRWALFLDGHHPATMA